MQSEAGLGSARAVGVDGREQERGTMGEISVERLEELRGQVLGDVLVSGDERRAFDTTNRRRRDVGASYEETLAPWNGMYDDRQPSVIVRCMGVADVQAALAFARAEG